MWSIRNEKSESIPELTWPTVIDGRPPFPPHPLDDEFEMTRAPSPTKSTPAALETCFRSIGASAARRSPSTNAQSVPSSLVSFSSSLSPGEQHRSDS